MDIVTIAVPHFDEVRYILCDYVDNALQSYGAALLTYYNSIEQAEELVSLGRIKILSASPRSRQNIPPSRQAREEHVTWTYSDTGALRFECRQGAPQVRPPVPLLSSRRLRDVRNRSRRARFCLRRYRASAAHIRAARSSPLKEA